MSSALVWAAIIALACLAVAVQARWAVVARLGRRLKAAVGPLASPRVAVLVALLAIINILALSQDARWDVTDAGRQATATAAAPAAPAKVYFTTGHAERDPSSAERLGYSRIAGLLEQERFATARLHLGETPAVPDDAAMVVVAGPKLDFFEPEVEALDRYLTRGGSILFLIDPVADLRRYVTESGAVLFMINPDSEMKNPELTRLTRFIDTLGVSVGSDIVVDLSGMGEFLGTDASVPVGARYPAHAITDEFSIVTAFPVARSVTPVDAAQPIVETSDRSWAETDVTELTSKGQVSMDQAKGDRQGPISLAVARSGPHPNSRVVVIGDSDFVANYIGNIPGNVDLLLRAVRWLGRRDPRPPAPTQPGEVRVVEMTAGRHQVVLWASVAIPLFAAIAGFVAWRRTAGRSS